MSKATKTEFLWTDDEIQLLLESVNQYRCKCEYEGINWESVRSKYERIKEIFIDLYPKNNVEGKDFPVLENPEVISKDRVAAKLKKIRQDYKKAADAKKKSGVGRVVFVFYDLCETIWGGSEDQILQQNQSTSERRESVTDLLNKRKDLKLTAKTRPEKRKLNYAEEDIQLKRKLIERIDKSDQEFKENLERINRTMENIGHSVQQSVGWNFTVKNLAKLLL